METIELIPAYRKDYQSAKEAKMAFNSNADFIVASSGEYCNKRDIEASGAFVIIRYRKLREITTLTVKKERA